MAATDDDDDVVNDGKELHGRKAGRFRPLTSFPVAPIFGLLTHCCQVSASSSSSSEEIMRGVAGRYKSLKFNPPQSNIDDDDVVVPVPVSVVVVVDEDSSQMSADRRRLIPARGVVSNVVVDVEIDSTELDKDDKGNSSQLKMDLHLLLLLLLLEEQDDEF